MIKCLLKHLFQMVIALAYRGYMAEGLNVLFLVMPSKLMIPTLVKHGAKIGEEVELHSPMVFHNVSEKRKNHYRNLYVGSNCYIGKEVFLDLADQIIIEDQVTISMRVTLLTHTHAGKSPLSSGKLIPYYAPIILRQGCYVGAGAIIVPGVIVGENAIIGAGAVVTHIVPPNSTVVGVPAHFIDRQDAFKEIDS